MKFKRSTYPDYPNVKGSPCWQLTGRWLYFDADWNTRFPFGVSMGIRIGPQRDDRNGLPVAPGFTLDVNAPLGEPNRLYLWGPKRQYMIGLVSWWTFKETGRDGRVVHGEHVRCRPRLVRGQAWDRKRSEGTLPPKWRWLVIHPNDWRERWARAHPEEAAAVAERRLARKKSS